MCEFCKRADFSNFMIEINKWGVSISLACGATRFKKEDQFNFCPNCGEDLRKEPT